MKRYIEFPLISIDVIDGKVFLLEAFGEEGISFMTGLDDATMPVAVIDENVTV
ncbi:hypothetical protein BHOIPH791_01530 [Bartonella henselae]|uniref:hypothetical protein n=1 Tax=Bartonella TaxID=773 RepID=UPI0002D983E6|nr:hypothetical protein [Bartonella henselae]MDM9983650.1 hypothetical protein [Bartonella henselae]MDM9985219.1 hypothetical protein [Bartonella henselae]MDM9986591.1 hypothetical protein [Bartonella henselae]MDM9987690.1 hypothetical protein [Bartonella henselae]MDM9989414.1 hypothetical protein [Bartonella henselae]